MKKNNIIRKFIREAVESIFDEERIPNPEADGYVRSGDNFLGSHTYGENIGDLDLMYVAYSYGEQHPLYVWLDQKEFKEMRPHETKNMVTNEGEDELGHTHLYNEEKADKDGDGHTILGKKGPWFYNKQPYYVRDKKGKLKPNKWTEKHLVDLKPNEKAQARDTRYLHNLIVDFKKKHGIGTNTHTNLRPGEK